MYIYSSHYASRMTLRRGTTLTSVMLSALKSLWWICPLMRMFPNTSIATITTTFSIPNQMLLPYNNESMLHLSTSPIQN